MDDLGKMLKDLQVSRRSRPNDWNKIMSNRSAEVDCTYLRTSDQRAGRVTPLRMPDGLFPRISRTPPSTLAWIALGTLVIMWELFCPAGELLSEAFDRWISVHPFLARMGIIVLAAHLANCIDPRIDPIHQLFVVLGARKRRTSS